DRGSVRVGRRRRAAPARSPRPQRNGAGLGPARQGGGDLRVHPADRADGPVGGATPAGALSVAPRPEPCRPGRPHAAAGRRHQARLQGVLYAGHRGAVDDGHRSGDLDHHRGAHARDHPLRSARRLRRRVRAGGHRRLDRASLLLRLRVDLVLRADARRLGLGVEVLVPRLDARRRSARLLRGGHRPVPARSGHDRGLAVAGRDRRGPGQHLVHHPPVRRLPDLHGRRLRRVLAAPVRPPRGRRRARRRLQHRVRRHALRHVLHGRVHGGAGHLGRGRGDLPRRLARPGTGVARTVVGPAQDAGARLPVHLGAGHPAPASLRPADDPRLEDSPAPRHPERARDRDPRGPPL
ncbi:MAG: NADH-ubiquinone oxidoreductase chain H, partial [uncultured Solirubrobacterales bacterium]